MTPTRCSAAVEEVTVANKTEEGEEPSREECWNVNPAYVGKQESRSTSRRGSCYENSEEPSVQVMKETVDDIKQRLKAMGTDLEMLRNAANRIKDDIDVSLENDNNLKNDEVAATTHDVVDDDEEDFASYTEWGEVLAKEDDLPTSNCISDIAEIAR